MRYVAPIDVDPLGKKRWQEEPGPAAEIEYRLAGPPAQALLRRPAPASHTERQLATLAACLLAGRGATLAALAEATGFSIAALREQLSLLPERLAAVDLAAVDDGLEVRLVPVPWVAEVVVRVTTVEVQQELTPEALEVMIIIGALGAPTRREIEDCRGADDCTSLLDRLCRRGLLEKSRDDSLRGDPNTYRLTAMALGTVGHATLESFQALVPRSDGRLTKHSDRLPTPASKALGHRGSYESSPVFASRGILPAAIEVGVAESESSGYWRAVMGRSRDLDLERRIATQRVVSAQIWLRRPRPAAAEARRTQVDAMIARVARLSGLRPISVDMEKECFASETHTTFWLEAPSAFMAILVLQPEIRETHFSGRSFALDPSVLIADGPEGPGL